MDREIAKLIIGHAVKTTEPTWRSYDEKWEDLDEIFIRRGYEQQGFEAFKFLPLLKARGCGSIEALGAIWQQRDGARYEPPRARGLASPFYVALYRGQRGPHGRTFYEAVSDFLQPGTGRKGGGFWMQLWRMLQACHYLSINHQSSFRIYLIDRYRAFSGNASAGEDELRSLAPQAWHEFVATMKPWKPLCGIGPNVFDFLVGDIVGVEFASSSYKLDSANVHFLTVTGIEEVIGSLDRERVIQFLSGLDLGYTLRQLNKGIYTYCSDTEAANYGFCGSPADCGRCRVETYCLKNFGPAKPLSRPVPCSGTSLQ